MAGTLIEEKDFQVEVNIFFEKPQNIKLHYSHLAADLQWLPFNDSSKISPQFIIKKK